MIESIQIKNFRGIGEGKIEGFRKFNLLVGPNNSGKSAVLEALYLANTADRAATMTERPGLIAQDVKTSDSDFLGYQPVLRVLERHSQDSSSVRSIGQNGDRVQISDASAPLPDPNIIYGPVSKRHLSDQPDVIALFSLNAEMYSSKQEVYARLARQLSGDEINPVEGSRLLYCWLPSLTRYGGSHATWRVNGGTAKSSHTLFCDVQTMLQPLPMDFFRRTIQTVPGWTQKIAKRFGAVFGINEPFNAQFFPVDQEQQEVQGWIAPSDQVALTIDNYGDGSRNVFKVLTPLLALAELVREDEPGLFLWDEPELFQNPQSLVRLLTEVTELLKDKPVQVFIATHSLEVVAQFTALAHEGKIAPDDLMAFRLNLQDGKLSSSWFTPDNLLAWTEHGLDPRVWDDFQSPLQFNFRNGKPIADEEVE